jgi:predicted peptidase
MNYGDMKLKWIGIAVGSIALLCGISLLPKMINQRSYDDYLLYVPKVLPESGQYPLLLFLHGAGERGKNLELLKKNGPPSFLSDTSDLDDIDVQKDVPAWAFHGKLDEIVSFRETERLVNKLRQIGGEVKFTLYPELEHDCWTVTYNNPDLYTWLLSKSKSTIN